MRPQKNTGAGLTGIGHFALCIACSLLLAVSPSPAEEPEIVDQSVPPRPSYNNYGVTGLIENPTAEFQPDGQVAFTSSWHNGFLRNTFAATVLPGIEFGFRYAALSGLATPGVGRGGNTIYDRSFDLRMRLVREARYHPSVVIGFQDMLGTGLFAGEYLVATKSFFEGNLKVTSGVGYGRLGATGTLNNSLRNISRKFDDRDADTSGGGRVNFGNLFHGEHIGLFGGLEWWTPVDGLSFKAELVGDDYDFEETHGEIDVNIPANFGVEYRLLDGLELGAYYMYGSSVGVRMTMTGNPFRTPVPFNDQPGPQPLIERPKPETEISAIGQVEDLVGAGSVTTSLKAAGITDVTIQKRADQVRWAEAVLPFPAGRGCPADTATALDAEYGSVDAVTFRHTEGQTLCTVALRPAGRVAIRLAQRAEQVHPTDWHEDETRRKEIVEALAAELDADELGLFGIEIAPTRVALYIKNGRYRSTPRALGRAARGLSRTMPPSVETFEIIPVEASLPVVSVILNRTELEAQVYRPDAARRAWLTARVGDARPLNPFNDPVVVQSFPRFSWSIGPGLGLNAFDPDEPLRADFAIKAGGGIELLPGLSLNASISQRLAGNLDEISIESDSVLPHVRSDIADYLRDGEPALLRLTGDFVAKLGGNVYGRLSGGYFERQFGGFGGEILWKPARQEWGLGADVYYARKRTSETLLDFQDYDIVTGHASLYWDTGFYGLSVQLDAGRYLAGDYGGTVTLKRRFGNGWEIGGFSTFTDVPFEEFGEGSFDKGLFFTIPLNWFLPTETRAKMSTVLRPLSRDGGQRLGISNRLYGVVENFDREALGGDWGSFWD